jgi:hypothetical protein
MMRHRANSHFTRPCEMGPPTVLASSFEEVVNDLCLSPEHYAESDELKAWVKRNKRLKYVPPELLRLFGFKGESEV